MSETITVTAASREGRYRELMPQLEALLKDETDMIACMANISAALRSALDFFWIGFYIVRENELVLGPFQGPVACTRIRKGKGVCGAAWNEQRTVIVPDVDQFPGHIACNSASRSEIVLPVFDGDRKMIGVLDVDSDSLNDFNDTDREALEKVCGLLKNKNLF